MNKVLSGLPKGKLLVLMGHNARPRAVDVLQHQALIARRIGIDPERVVLQLNPTRIRIQGLTSAEKERVRSAVYDYWSDLGPLTEQEEHEIEMLL